MSGTGLVLPHLNTVEEARAAVVAEELLDYGLLPEDIGEMIDRSWTNLNEPELLYYRRKMEALLARHQLSR